MTNILNSYFTFLRFKTVTFNGRQVVCSNCRNGAVGADILRLFILGSLIPAREERKNHLPPLSTNYEVIKDQNTIKNKILQQKILNIWSNIVYNMLQADFPCGVLSAM
jgi:hypothetical protein